MQILLTFDHELFFGQFSGSPERCLIEPGRALSAVAGELSAPLCFFVDAGYLVALRRLAPSHIALQAHELAVRRSLDELAGQGHELLLHVHPHWEDATWSDHGRWNFDLARYALSAFDDSAVTNIVQRYADELRPHVSGGRIHAYRAGGWAVQPFEPIGRGLRAAGIAIDSTVFAGGSDASGAGRYDFSDAPAKCMWRFDTDPAREAPDGAFLEVATSSMRVPPSYYWRQAMSRFGPRANLQPFGDGVVRAMAVGSNLRDKLTKLMSATRYCVTLDGQKAGLALPEYLRARRRGVELLVLLSHPKMMTPTSIRHMRALLRAARQNGDQVVGYQQIAIQAGVA